MRFIQYFGAIYLLERWKSIGMDGFSEMFSHYFQSYSVNTETATDTGTLATVVCLLIEDKSRLNISLN